MNKKLTPSNYSEQDDVYGSLELSRSLPKNQFPKEERDPRNVFSAVRDELMLDGNSRQNKASHFYEKLN